MSQTRPSHSPPLSARRLAVNTARKKLGRSASSYRMQDSDSTTHTLSPFSLCLDCALIGQGNYHSHVAEVTAKVSQTETRGPARASRAHRRLGMLCGKQAADSYLNGCSGEACELLNVLALFTNNCPNSLSWNKEVDHLLFWS